MRNSRWGFVALLLCISGVHAEQGTPADAPKQNTLAPSWAPGPMVGEEIPPPPGRVASRNVGVAFTLPESWRGEDVSWRELEATEASAINELAQAALVVEFKAAKGPVKPLLTVYRVPLKPWREAARINESGPGRLTLTTPDNGFVVIRPSEDKTSKRYQALRLDLEDAIGTMARYDAYREREHPIPNLEPEFSGTLEDGSAVRLKLNPNSTLTLTWGKKSQSIKGRWFQRDSQVVITLTIPTVQVSPRLEVDKDLLLHYDGKGLIVIQWDQKVFGAAGVRLDPPQ